MSLDSAGATTVEFRNLSIEHQKWAQKSVEKFKEMGCLYEPGRYSPTALCISESAFTQMIDDVRALLMLARRRAFESRQALVWARPDQRELVEQWMDKPLLPIMARPDGIISDGHLKMLELNIDSGLGGYFEVELVQERLSELNSRFLDNAYLVPTLMEPICRYLIGIAASLDKSEWAVAIMIDSHLTPYNASHAFKFADYVNMRVPGARAKVVYSAEIYREDGFLRDQDDRFDIVWRFGSMAHPPEKLETSIRVQKLAHGANVIMVCNPADIGVEGKLVLADLSSLADSENFILTEDEKTLVKKMVPWTRLVEDCSTIYDNKVSSLLSLIENFKDDFVLKRSHSKSALHVFIGVELSKEDWKNRITEALEDDVPWVIQKNIKSDKLKFDYMEPDGKVGEIYQSYSLNPFIFGTEYCPPFIRVERNDNNRRLAIANVDAMAICGLVIKPEI
jgi:hypothetical protein